MDLGIFDVAGRHVRSLLRGNFAAGERVVVWDGRDDAGGQSPSGVYFARLRCNGGERRIRLIRSQ